MFYLCSDSTWLTVSYDKTFTYHKLGYLVNSIILSSKTDSVVVPKKARINSIKARDGRLELNRRH